MDSNLSSNKSTNGRSANKRAEAELARIRGILRMLDAVSPRLAARLAEPLFRTPRKHRRPAEESRVMAAASRTHFEIEGHVIPVYSWGSGPVVLFSHGWEGRGSQVAPFVTPLLKAGFRVVSFDQPGHGEAKFARVTMLEFAKTIEGIVARLGDVHAVIGHSLGGTAAVWARSRNVFGKRLVTIASPLHPREFLAGFAKLLALSPEAVEGVKALLGAHYGLSFAQIDLREVTPTLDVGALVVHDRDDREVPYEHGLELFRHWPRAQFFATQGLGHRRVLKDESVIAKVMEVVSGAPKTPSVEQLLDAELYEPLLRAG